MPDPVVALGIAAGVGVLGALLYLPGRIVFRRLRDRLGATSRVHVEDALKHVFDCECHGSRCTVHSLGGALGLPAARAVRLLESLQRSGLVSGAGGATTLTPDGRRYALRVIRIHRLWEHYLSERTGLDESEWHARAEVEEHRTSVHEAELLAARMGDPRYDPHGDPIPTAGGEIVPPRGVPLPDLAPGEVAEIVHVEDEPPAVYERILARGLSPGQRVRILDRSEARVRFRDEFREHDLPAIVAANLWAEPLPEDERSTVPVRPLSRLGQGESAVVVRIAPACRGPERSRLLDLGVVPGTRVTMEMTSAAGDPVAYRVRGALIALRREQAERIHVEAASAGSAS